MAEITLTFPDGAARQFPAGISGAEVAASISKSLAKKAVAMTLDGDLRDLADPIDADATIGS
jgi:threonyl-tRNA synthetase